MSLRDDYLNRYENCLIQMASGIESYIKDCLHGVPRIDRVSARAKTPDRFLAKAEIKRDEKNKYLDPINEIQDQIGARIITFYLSDVENISKTVLRYLRPIETQNIVPEREWEFGYFSRHHILLIPSDVIPYNVDLNHIPQFFELQIKTLFQHAWSEAEHDLGYKPGATPLTPEQKRRFAYTSAQAWGADRMFDELFRDRTCPHPGDSK